jgi:FixJ family two-component response regulator
MERLTTMKSSKMPSVKINADEQACCLKVINQVKKLELKILYAYANGRSRKQVASQLGISIKTVEMYTTSLRERCLNAWDIQLGEKLPNRFLDTRFAEAFQVWEMGNAEEGIDESMILF